MPVKKKVDKKKKLKQKQKQKQIVKQNVKVTVQSSGGSGGGGSSVPSRFTDNTGENVRLQGLIEQLSRRIPMSVPMPVKQPVLIENPVEMPAVFSKPRALQEERAKAKLASDYNPSNDNETLNKVYYAPNNNNNSISERILADKLQQIDPEGYEANLDDIQGVFNSNLSNKFVDEEGEEFALSQKLRKIESLKKDVGELQALGGMLEKRSKEAFAESGIEAPYGFTPSGRIRKKPLGSKKVTYSGSEGEM